MDTDLDTLATALYVTVDDLLIAYPEQLPPRPKVGIQPKTTDSEMITLAVMAALLGFTREARWVRWAKKHLTGWFPSIPNQPGYNKRMRKLAGTMSWVQRQLAMSCDEWSDGVWVVDSTPVETGRSRPTVQRSDMARYAQYGYCASHSRYFWGLRVHMVSTLGGLQMIAILGAEDAPDRIEFALDLPKGTELIQQPDGSIAIFAEVETRSVPDSEARRVTAAAEAVLGRDFDENTVITDRQWERLAAIPEAETVVASQLQEIGSVAAPWAVDSVGRSLPTHYEVTGGSLTQVVVTDLNTAFPVTADPTWVWWVGTTALCVVDLGTYVLPGGAAAKVAKGITKIKSAMTKSAALKKAVDKLGGMQKALKTALQYMKDKSRLSKANQAYVQQLFKGGGKLLFDAIGLGSCYALVMEGK